MSCGAPAATAAPAQPEAPPAAAPQPEAPQPAAAPLPQPPPPVAAPPPYTPPPPASGPQVAKPGGMSRNTIIGIVALVVVAVVIGIFVQRSEREFQRERRASQASAGTSGSSTSSTTSPPAQAGAPSSSYGGFNSGGAVGSEGWTRQQLVGRWNDRPGCAEAIEFRADGSTHSGRWSLQGARLSLIESNGTTVVELVSIGTHEMVLAPLSGQGQTTWRRC